jgi:7-carboxy-7-deazaguanine synthase
MTRPGALRVSEVFGPTFQGEGPSAGQRAAFIRLSGCPVGCAYCDTPYTWDASRFDLAAETTERTVVDLAAWTASVDSDLVVVTGGEPLVQQRALVELADALRRRGRRVEVETSGVIPPVAALTEAVAAFNVSPKLANSAVPEPHRFRPRALERFVQSGKAVFKFVVTGLADLDEVGELAARFDLTPVWIMPEGTGHDEVTARMRLLADAVLARGWNLTGRLHVALWGDTRGR